MEKYCNDSPGIFEDILVRACLSLILAIGYLQLATLCS